MQTTEDEKKELYDLLELSDITKKNIIANIIQKNGLMPSIDVSPDVYKDTKIDTWVETLPTLEGSKILINTLVKNPTDNIELLKKRQNAYSKYNLNFDNLRSLEDDVLWVYKLNNEIKENNLINILFPKSYVLSFINHFEYILEMYHGYKIYMVPMNTIIYPILSLLSPWYYFNRYLKFNISLKTYVEIIYKFFKFLFTFSANIKVSLIRIIMIIAYSCLFVYNIYQTLEYSYMLYDIRKTLLKKIKNLNEFLNETKEIFKVFPEHIIKPFVEISNIEDIKLKNNSASIYKLWKNDHIKTNISKILLKIYTIDIINSVSKLKNRKSWCIANYTDNTKLWNMKNPILSNSQNANPIDLTKNIIVTGPNAAGKTTYVKSILSNIILAQTLGVSYAYRANIKIYNTIISFMRISDILGSKSYFEVEAEYCSKMMDKAKYISDNNMCGLFIMDEPMHSTPPTEGMSTAFAVTEYIGNMKSSNIILTTHFHKLTYLEEIYPDRFINLSVEAIQQDNGEFYFPYCIKRGHSFQCIAIELLSSKMFPKPVIDSAINMKNKIYREINSR